jgi:hypothetical protein
MGVVGYLDPGSGSLIAATAAAGLAGMSVAAKAMWSKGTGRLKRNKGDDAGQAESIEAGAADLTDPQTGPAVELD